MAKLKMARQLLRELYRGNAEPFKRLPKDLYRWRMRHHAGRLRWVTENLRTRKLPITKLKEWWRRYHRQGDESISPSRVYQILTSPVKISRRGELRGGYGYPKEIASMMASMVASKRGIPDVYSPAWKRVMYRKKPVLNRFKEVVRRRAQSAVPTYINIGRFPNWEHRVASRILRQKHAGKKLSPKQAFIMRRQFGEGARVPFGATVGRTPIPKGVGPFYRNRVRAIREAKSMVAREVEAMKHGTSIAAHGALAGGAFHIGRRSFRPRRKKNVDKISKADPTSYTNKRLLRNMLLSGFILAGLGALSNLLRSGYSKGIKVSSGQQPTFSDSPSTVKAKINDIARQSNVTSGTVNAMMGTYKTIIPSTEHGQSSSSIEERFRSLSEEKRSKLADRRQMLLAIRAQRKLWRSIDAGLPGENKPRVYD